MHPSARRAAVGVVAFVLVVADALVGRPPTAALCMAGIAVATGVLGVDGVRALRRRAAPKAVGALLVVLLIFAALRGYVFALQLATLTPLHSAALTYDVVWLALAGAASAALWANPRAALVVRLVWSRPRRVLSGSFAMLILVASVLLTLPISVRDVTEVSILDAIFTATSAVCVTGLAVNDIHETYTAFGQGVILVAIQLGGIGIMTLAAFAVAALKDATSRESGYMRILDADSIADLRSMVRVLVAGTLLFEAAGAAALFTLWSGRDDLDGRSVLWLALFHSVSAFCNAGFSLFSDSMARFTDDPLSLLIIMLLAIAGGLGFPVWRGLAAHSGGRAWHFVNRKAPRPVRLPFGARVPLAVSAALVAAGALAFAVLEWNSALAPLGVASRAVNALFCSVIARTTGFTTVGFEAMTDAALLVTMALMFVGGSPGSTAGGIKTTTVAVIGAAVRAELRGHEPHIFGRALTREVVRRAVAVLTIALVVVFAALFALSLTEEQPLRRLAFEVISAFSTTGLSTGLTPLLTPAGKVIVIATMFAGRVGPLTIALALSVERTRALHRLPTETLPVG